MISAIHVAVERIHVPIIAVIPLPSVMLPSGVNPITPARPTILIPLSDVPRERKMIAGIATYPRIVIALIPLNEKIPIITALNAIQMYSPICPQ